MSESFSLLDLGLMVSSALKEYQEMPFKAAEKEMWAYCLYDMGQELQEATEPYMKARRRVKKIQMEQQLMEEENGRD